MTAERKAELFDEMLGYLVNLVGDEEELQRVLMGLGFTEEELEYENL